MPYQNITAREAVRKFKEGTLSILDYNKWFIQQTKAFNPEIHAWVNFKEDVWLCAAEAAEGQKEASHTGLLGIPIGVKDIFNTRDFATSMGSSLWDGFTPGNDARVIYNIRFQQGIIAGKTVTAEFAVHAPNETRNPWNTAYSPGTSSSGSAAAVAAGMTPMALGTQTAGSIIRPASYCGVYGYKPTFGTIPRTGMLKTTDTLDAVGHFTRNIDDCRLLFDVIRVHGLDYPIVHRNLQDDAPVQQKNGKNWKVGAILDQHWTCEYQANYAREAFKNFLKEATNAGIAISYPDQLPPFFNESHKTQKIIYHKALSYYFKKEFEAKTLISDVMYEIVNEGKAISLDQYQEALAQQTVLANGMDQLFGDYDVLVTLSTAGTAPKFGTAIDPPDTCLVWSLCGLPVINIPLFMHNGLPFGLQIIGRKYADYKLIAFANEMVENGLFPVFSTLATTPKNIAL
jgi:Asp-tRNA(Asn)/Glu-tRNA(Gln) amidotransferase A subunit family amidase